MTKQEQGVIDLLKTTLKLSEPIITKAVEDRVAEGRQEGKQSVYDQIRGVVEKMEKLEGEASKKDTSFSYGRYQGIESALELLRALLPRPEEEEG